MHYAVPAILEQHLMLDRLYTDICAEVGWVRFAGKLLPRRLLPRSVRRLFDRHIDGVPREKIVSFNRFGIARILLRRNAGTPSRYYANIFRANKQFGRIVCKYGLGSASHLYAYNAAAVELFEYAKAHGIKMILEQIAAPIAFDEKLLADERERWPGWEAGGAAPSDWQPVADRESAEWKLADRIVCGSDYVVSAMSKEDGPVGKCRVVPYGIDVGRFSPQSNKPRSKDQPLRVLCVATLQLRKGVQYLMEAARLLKDDNVTIRLIGPCMVSDDALSQLKTSIEVVGAIPRSEMAREFAAADVFALPTLSEGSAIVCYEALAAGLPVVTTAAAGSVVRDGVDGWLVPIRSAEALANQLRFISQNRDCLHSFSLSAASRAQDYTWRAYGDRLTGVIREMDAID